MCNVRWASIGWTLQEITAALIAFDFDFPPGENSIAYDADPFVIQRIPFPIGIACAQNLETFFRCKMFSHVAHYIAWQNELDFL
jgi:hypothetical protein